MGHITFHLIFVLKMKGNEGPILYSCHRLLLINDDMKRGKEGSHQSGRHFNVYPGRWLPSFNLSSYSYSHSAHWYNC